MIHIFLVYVTGSFMSLIKAILVGHVINQGRKVNDGTHAKKDRPKKMLRRCYLLADVIIFVYELPCIFWHLLMLTN